MTINAANTFTINSDNNEKNQTNLVVMVVSHAKNNPINISGEDTMCSQVQTTVVEISLPQNNVVSTTNTPPFSTTRPWGMPPISNEMHMPQLSLPVPQSQNTIPPIVVSRQTNRLLELWGKNHSYDAN